jgi:hypothetical protein
VLIRPADNDIDSGMDGYRITAIDGQAITPDAPVKVTGAPWC